MRRTVPLYSWSFAPDPGWVRRYSGQAEILDYLRETARETGVRDHVRTGIEVTGADFAKSTLTWQVHTATGETFEADLTSSISSDDNLAWCLRATTTSSCRGSVALTP